MSGVLKRLRELFLYRTRGGHAYPRWPTISETIPDIPLANVIKLYERDPTCKASVDLLASATVGMGFYTTVNEGYERAGEAKEVVDGFNEKVNLDGLLNDMAKVLIACGNDFWLRLTPEKLKDLHRLPTDAVEKIKQGYIKENSLKIPYNVEYYKLHRNYGGEMLDPKAVIHWRINYIGKDGFGTGLLQVLLHTLVFQSNKRPAYAWMKAKIEKILPKIFEKYAGPDVLVLLEKADDETIQKFERTIKSRPEEGAWLFYSGKGDIKPVTIDPRARFEFYIDHIINQFYLGLETPLPRLFSTPGFTEASARAALDLQDMLIKPIQRYIKRQVERDIFAPILLQAGFDSAKAKVRLNWGAKETPKVELVDMLRAAELGLIRPDFWIDNMFFGGRRYESTQQDSASQTNYGLRESVEVDEELYSDNECQLRAKALLAHLKDPAEHLTLRSTVIDYGNTPLLPGDKTHVTLPNENVDADFRILSVEYRVDARTQTLEITLELGKEPVLLADYLYALRSKADSLSRYKIARAI